ncbi:MAG TPA: nitroreductase family deazaflavin-dependent oxidoreductase [Acidimicrobiales bacterium]|nr:nitroreductase family deazaflavin-dependent oxidoreductase [Acidimicrobiales bacterium]
MPSDATFKVLNSFHKAAVKVSGGKLGWRGSGMPMLQLTTIGRKSGQPHTVMLSSPLQEGDRIIIVASRGGDDRHPSWFLNLRGNPDVQVALAGAPARPMTARVAEPPERERLWARLTADHANYAGYQRKTSREIPVVVLEPAP